MELGASRAFILRDEAEAALVFSRAHLIGAWSRETLSYVLEARVLGGLWSQTVHETLMQLLCGLKIILTRAWHDRINTKILFKVLLLKVIT